MSKLNEWGIKVLKTEYPQKTIEFNVWITQLKVSSCYRDREGIIKAGDLNKQYNFLKLRK
jgi:hypothetical protein